MRTLRIVAIFSNIVFVTYSALEWLPPVLILHLTLLPLNVLRLREIVRAVSVRGQDMPAQRPSMSVLGSWLERNKVVTMVLASWRYNAMAVPRNLLLLWKTVMLPFARSSRAMPTRIVDNLMTPLRGRRRYIFASGPSFQELHFDGPSLSGQGGGVVTLPPTRSLIGFGDATGGDRLSLFSF
jgi:hypothetical protein